MIDGPLWERRQVSEGRSVCECSYDLQQGSFVRLVKWLLYAMSDGGGGRVGRCAEDGGLDQMRGTCAPSSCILFVS